MVIGEQGLAALAFGTFAEVYEMCGGVGDGRRSMKSVALNISGVFGPFGRLFSQISFGGF